MDVQPALSSQSLGLLALVGARLMEGKVFGFKCWRGRGGWVGVESIFIHPSATAIHHLVRWSLMKSPRAILEDVMI